MEIKEKFKRIFARCGIWVCIGRIIDFILLIAFATASLSWTIVSFLLSLLVGFVFYIAFYWDKSFLKLNFTLYIFSMFMKIGLFPFGMLYKIFYTILFSNQITEELSKYYRDIAVANDQAGNVYMEELFNKTLIHETGYKFGNPDETISGVLGKNYYNNSLRMAGKVLSLILELLDPGHLANSIEADENWKMKRKRW